MHMLHNGPLTLTFNIYIYRLIFSRAEEGVLVNVICVDGFGCNMVALFYFWLPLP